MKTYTIGIVSAAFLMVVACVGFRIAQAAGTHADRPVLSFEDQVALKKGSSSSPYVLALPIAIDVAQARGAVEPGSLSAATPGPTVVFQAKDPLTVVKGEYELITTILDFQPGAGIANHMHGGNVLVTVLGGEITLREKGTEKIVITGESWTESPGNVHTVVNAGTATARVAAVFLLPKGAEATTMVR